MAQVSLCDQDGVVSNICLSCVTSYSHILRPLLVLMFCFQFMSIRLRSLALGMNHPVKCSDWWGKIAEDVLEEEGLPYDSWTYDMLMEHRPEFNMQKFKFA